MIFRKVSIVSCGECPNNGLTHHWDYKTCRLMGMEFTDSELGTLFIGFPDWCPLEKVEIKTEKKDAMQIM